MNVAFRFAGMSLVGGMRMLCLGLVAAGLLLGTQAKAELRKREALVPQSVARQAGLERAWFTQVQLDSRQQHVVGAQLEGETLYVLSSDGHLHALDATTGSTRWEARVGSPNQLPYGPAAHGEHVAIVVGSKLYVFETTKGREVFSRYVGGAVGGGPVMTEKRIFVPMATGRVEAYTLDNAPDSRWRFASQGMVVNPPALAGGRVLWTTDRGYLYGTTEKGQGAAYRFDAGTELVGPATAHKDDVIIPARNGDLYAISVEKGGLRWRATLGIEVGRPAQVVGDTIYVGTDPTGLLAIEPGSGAIRWEQKGIDQLVCVAGDRLYAMGSEGALVVLDVESGEVLADWQPQGNLHPLINTQTDWAYFVGRDGLVQCFHQPGSEAPQLHSAKKNNEGDPAEQPAEAEDMNDGFDEFNNEPTDEEDPFAAGPVEEPAPAADDPFAADPFGDAPTEEAPPASDSDDPFADF